MRREVPETPSHVPLARRDLPGRANGKCPQIVFGYDQRVTLSWSSPMTRYVPIALVLVLAAPALAETRTDLLGDPLPEGAVARIGSVRYRIGKVGPYALSPDGKTLAVEGPLGVMLWDVETGKPLLRISLRGHSMCDIDRTPMGFTPDGKNLVWVYGDELRVCDVATGRTRFGAQLPHALVAVGFLPGTTRFAVLESTG